LGISRVQNAQEVQESARSRREGARRSMPDEPLSEGREGSASRGTRSAIKGWLAIGAAAFAIGCGSIKFDEDVPEDDVQQDIVEVQPDQAEDTPDSEIAPDVPDVMPDETPDHEDVGPDVPDVHPDEAGDVPVETPEYVDVVPETPDVVPDETIMDVPDSEDAGCTPNVTTVPSAGVTGPTLMCGSTQTATSFTEVTTWDGPGCDGMEPESLMVRKLIEFSPPLDAGSLACARGATIRALNGDELVITLVSGRMESATQIAGNHLIVGDILDAGTGELKIFINNIIPPNTYTILLDGDSAAIGDLMVPNTGMTLMDPTPHDAVDDAVMAAVAWNPVGGPIREVDMAIVPRAINTRTSGSTEAWTAGGGNYTWTENTSGAEYLSIEWNRVR